MLPSLIAAWVALFAFAKVSTAQSQAGRGNSATRPSGASNADPAARTPATNTSSAGHATTASTGSATMACNNSPSLCGRAYNNITHMGAHNAPFLRDATTGFSISGNQFYNATAALDAGLRLLQAQVHRAQSGDGLQLCHTTCTLLDAGSLAAFLAAVKDWMDAHPHDVVTLLLVNSDGFAAADFGAVFEASGIVSHAYAPPSTASPLAAWPSLQTLIDGRTRLITFVTDITTTAAHPYLLYEFDYLFETAFTVTSLAAFNCSLARPSGLGGATAALSAGYMPLLNHFANTAQFLGITVPDVGNISTTNAADTATLGAAGTHGASCAREWGVRPTFMLVDFWNVGPSVATADALNGLDGRTTGRTSVSADVLTAADSESEAGGWGRARAGGVFAWAAVMTTASLWL